MTTGAPTLPRLPASWTRTPTSPQPTGRCCCDLHRTGRSPSSPCATTRRRRRPRSGSAQCSGRECAWSLPTEDVDVALRAVHDPRLHAERLSFSVGTRWNTGLRTRSVHARVVRVTELMVQAEADYPNGTLVFEPFLRVVDAEGGR